MGIKVEVVSPVSSVSEVPGTSTAVVVVKPAQTPISTSSNQAVVEVVKTVSVINNVVVSSTAPSAPFEGMAWIEIL